MVRGYSIRKLPLGKFFAAVEHLKSVPGDLLSVCFPGQTPGAILGELKEFDEAALQRALGNLLIAAPRQIIRVAAALIEADEAALLEDPDLGLDGLAELLDAWIEVNDIANFLRAARGLIGKTRRAARISPTPNTGSSGSSPRVSNSESQNEPFWKTIFPEKSQP
jgi:hypothetical protein